MFELSWPWMLLALPVPLLVYLFARPVKSSRSALPVPFYREIESSGAELDNRKKIWTKLGMFLAWLLLVIASARPLWLGEPTQIPVSGRDIMMAVDISGSMKAEDMEFNGNVENRLSTVKRVGEDFISRRQGDRVGLILFGTHAYLQAPLTFDLETVSTLLNEAAIGIAGEKTAVGNAVGLAVKRLQTHYGESSDDRKILILLTDGANTAGNVDPVEASELAKQIGLKIYAIGVGAEIMTVNTIFGQQVVSPSTELDETTLQRMAEVTGGQYFRAVDPESLEDIYSLIDEVEPIIEEAKYLRPKTELFHWFLCLSMVLVLLLCLQRIFATSDVSKNFRNLSEQESIGYQ